MARTYKSLTQNREVEGYAHREHRSKRGRKKNYREQAKLIIKDRKARWDKRLLREQLRSAII